MKNQIVSNNKKLARKHLQRIKKNLYSNSKTSGEKPQIDFQRKSVPY